MSIRTLLLSLWKLWAFLVKFCLKDSPFILKVKWQYTQKLKCHHRHQQKQCLNLASFLHEILMTADTWQRLWMSLPHSHFEDKPYPTFPTPLHSIWCHSILFSSSKECNNCVSLHYNQLHTPQSTWDKVSQKLSMLNHTGNPGNTPSLVTCTFHRSHATYWSGKGQVGVVKKILFQC